MYWWNILQTCHTFWKIHLSCRPSTHFSLRKVYELQVKSILQVTSKNGIYQTYTEPHPPWKNLEEPEIREAKRHAKRIMQYTNSTVRLWYLWYKFTADLLSLFATGNFELQGLTTYKAFMNYTPDISEYASYSWFQWCWFYDKNMKKTCR